MCIIIAIYIIFISICDSFLFTGNYKVEMFDQNKNQFVPTLVGLGMLVEVKDPDDKELLSRVNLVSLYRW